MVMDCLSTKDNMLYIDGVSAADLVKEFKTPLYVYSEKTIRSAMAQFRESINDFYNGNGMVLYASKAFSCKEMYRLAKEENIGVDCVSGGEIYTALSAGFNPKNIVFHGNNKTYDELEFAVKENVGRIIADNFDDLDLIALVAKENKKTVNIQLRITPGIDAHTHDFIKTGQDDSKFGFTLSNGSAFKAAEKAFNTEYINVLGFHCHIGSQIFETLPFEEAAKVMIGFIKEIKEKLGKEIKELNLGGGFGIKYLESDSPKKFTEFLKDVSKILITATKAADIAVPKIFIEPGRSIVAPAGLTLYTVGNIKEIKGMHNYVSIDGGMGDNPRFALYGAKYTVLVANKTEEPKNYTANIVGKCCESGDIIAENVKISKPERNDILAVLATGAYNYSMASNYNRIPRPAAVLVNDKKAKIIIKRETYEDLVKNDI